MTNKNSKKEKIKKDRIIKINFPEEIFQIKRIYWIPRSINKNYTSTNKFHYQTYEIVVPLDLSLEASREKNRLLKTKWNNSDHLKVTIESGKNHPRILKLVSKNNLRTIT